MIDLSSLERTLRLVVDLLVANDYEGLERLTHGVHLRASEIEGGVRDYGRTLTQPPPEAFSNADIIPIQGAAPPAYSVRFPLFTLEQGKSDLELQATFIRDSADQLMRVELDNIIVA